MLERQPFQQDVTAAISEAEQIGAEYQPGREDPRILLLGKSSMKLFINWLEQEWENESLYSKKYRTSPERRQRAQKALDPESFLSVLHDRFTEAYLPTDVRQILPITLTQSELDGVGSKIYGEPRLTSDAHGVWKTPAQIRLEEAFTKLNDAFQLAPLAEE